MQFVLIGLVLLIYGLLNFYIGLRGYQSISYQIPINKTVYWIIIFLLASMYFGSMLGKKYLPSMLDRAFNIIGGYWLAAMVYLAFFVILIDIFRYLGKKLKVIPDILSNNTWFIAFSVIAIVAVTLAVGTYNSIIPKITKYDININKKAGNMKQLRVAMISDIHLGEIVGRERLNTAVKLINGLNADMVVIVGDLIDNDIEPVKKYNMLDELKDIKSKYGVYAIMGNHEYYGGKTEEITKMIENSGVTVLRDKVLKIQNSFYLAGREDFAGSFYGYKRKDLATLLNGIDKNLPLILLDHQPKNLDEPRKEKIDLQLSGHTHAGQFFPVSLITSLMYEEDNGYLKDENFNLIVSSGYGTWGPIVRIGSQSEIVDININFLK